MANIEERGRREPAEQRRRSGRNEGVPTLFGPSPFAFVRRLADDIDRLFEEFGGARGGMAALGSGEWEPAMEVEERDSEIVVRAEIPGVKREDLDVELSGDQLCISGTRQDERREEREGYFQSERRYGRFCRRLSLPEGVSPDEARAEFADGVLEITIPLPERQRSRRRIEVRGREPGERGETAERAGTSERAGAAERGGGAAGRAGGTAERSAGAGEGRGGGEARGGKGSERSEGGRST